MTTYYEITGTIDGTSEVLFGSFDKSDCTYEMDAERDSWKDQGYKLISLNSRETTDTPDPEVYGIDVNPETDIDIEESDLNGFNAMFKQSPGAMGIKGCPMGRGETRDAAIADLVRRTEMESAPVTINLVTPSHYYACNAMGWATAETRDAAITKLVRSDESTFKTFIKNSHKAGDAGAYVWSVKVLAPIGAKYDIEWYKPVGVDLEAGAEHFITHISKAHVAYTNSGDKQ